MEYTAQAHADLTQNTGIKSGESWQYGTELRDLVTTVSQMIHIVWDGYIWSGWFITVLMQSQRWDNCGIFTTEIIFEIRAWIINYILNMLWDMIIYTYTTVNSNYRAPIQYKDVILPV